MSDQDVAPLNVVKGKPRPQVPHLTFSTDITSAAAFPEGKPVYMTPPLTPFEKGDEMGDRADPGRAVFHNYLRAFYPFHPSGAVSPSTVTLPLDQGDIILVHSVHINGWADGTLLETGDRGWLPTN